MRKGKAMIKSGFCFSLRALRFCGFARVLCFAA
jgi:hypothetical protein